MTYEDAYYYRLLLQAGFTAEFDAWFDARLASDTPYSDIVVDLAMCRSDINETISLLRRYGDGKDFNETLLPALRERLRLFLKDAYHGGRLTKKETVDAMYSFAIAHGYPDDWNFNERLWGDMYYMSTCYEMAADGIASWENFDAIFLDYLDRGIPLIYDRIWQRPQDRAVKHMHRILIIGSNGAGKTTFAYTLRDLTGLPLIHIDKIYWRGRWEVTPPDEIAKRLNDEIRKPQWIIEGNNLKTLDLRLMFAETVFWFEFSPLTCLKNIIKRHLKNRGKSRPDLPPECISRIDLNFLKSAWTFNRRNRARIHALLEGNPHLTVIRFTNRRQVAKYLKSA